jgi:hypothetical protein
MVRSFSIHDEEHWSIEQEITVYVKPNGPHWTGVPLPEFPAMLLARC